MESNNNQENESKDAKTKGGENDKQYTRKRRLSKKERQNLKKKRKLQQQENKDIKVGVGNENEKAKNEDKIDEFDYLVGYEPIKVDPSKGAVSSSSSSTGKEEHKKNLGRWFPNARVVKSSPQTDNNQTKNNDNDMTCTILLFYLYVTPKWTKERVDQLIPLLEEIGKRRKIYGRIRVAEEGVNATLSCIGHTSQTQQKEHGCIAMRHFTQDLIQFDRDNFTKCDFKFIDHLPCDRNFKELKIMPVQELVFYGVSEKEAPLENGGIHLPPKEFHEMLSRDDAVVIDVRNHYETMIGRFDGQEDNSKKSGEQGDSNSNTHETQQQQQHGAKYIDPMMRKSTDFKMWLDKPETQENLEGKKVLLYCTGGIRCERASSLLKTKLHDKVDQVYQLHGGIEKYLKEFKDGGFWRGKNFVFDKREAISAENFSGDGGVIGKNKSKKKTSKTNSDNIKAANVSTDTKCCCCGELWDRYVGKKKCYTCGVPVLMCDKCMSQKLDKKPGNELAVRCPLCVKENITVPANEMEYTDNGIKCSNSNDSTSSEQKRQGEGGNQNSQNNKEGRLAASSVLKWGGGHGNKKKEKRRLSRSKKKRAAEEKVKSAQKS